MGNTIKGDRSQSGELDRNTRGKMDRRTDLHLFEALQHHPSPMSDEHDIIGNRFRVGTDETTVQGRQHNTALEQTCLNMRSRLTSGQIE